MIELLSNTGYIMVNKTLIKRIGLHEALMLGELCSEYSYWKSTGKLDEEGYFFSTRENIEENIGLSSFQQRKAMTTLKELGIIEEIAKGLPAKNYYRIIESRIAEIMDAEGVNNKMSNNLTTGHEEIKQQDEKKLNTNKNNITRINITPPPSEIISQEGINIIKNSIEKAGKVLGIKNYARLDIFYNTKIVF